MPLKILLINPPYNTGGVEASGTWLPVGLFYLAGSLSPTYNVEIFDAMNEQRTISDIEEKIRSFAPEIVATGTFTASYKAGVEVLRTAKKIDPKIITVMGGIHPTFMYEDVLTDNRHMIDYAVIGEGERTIREFADAINTGTDLGTVRGLAYLRGEEMIVAPERDFIDDLDSIRPAWELVNWESYFFRPYKTRMAVLTSSRGCIHDCSFCSQKKFWKQSWRGRSPQNFVNEVIYLNSTFGVSTFVLTDEIPTYDRDRWIDILNLLVKADLDIKIFIETRVDDILRDENILSLYRRANIVHIYVGVEATDQATLDLYNKNLKVEESKKALDLINEHDMISETSFVVGTPDDTKESLRKTLELAKYYSPDLAFFLAITPWPYSDIAEIFAPHVISRDYAKYNLIEPVVKPKAMTIAELKLEMNNMFKEFYLHKMANLDKLSDFKRGYMIECFKLLREHSYLKDQMKELFEDPETLKMIHKMAR